jgi:hypothetical protein
MPAFFVLQKHPFYFDCTTLVSYFLALYIKVITD